MLDVVPAQQAAHAVRDEHDCRGWIGQPPPPRVQPLLEDVGARANVLPPVGALGQDHRDRCLHPGICVEHRRRGGEEQLARASGEDGRGELVGERGIHRLRPRGVPGCGSETQRAGADGDDVAVGKGRRLPSDRDAVQSGDVGGAEVGDRAAVAGGDERMVARDRRVRQRDVAIGAAADEHAVLFDDVLPDLALRSDLVQEAPRHGGPHYTTGMTAR